VQSDGIKDWRPLLERFSKQPHVIAAAPAIYEKVLISRGPRASGAVLKGMIPAEERKVSDLLKSITIGSANDLEESLPSVGSDLRGEQSASVGSGLRPGQRGSETRLPTSPDLLSGVQQRVAAMPPIIPGKDMADALGATVGSVVLVTSPQGELTPFGMVPKYIRFRVVGIFNSDDGHGKSQGHCGAHVDGHAPLASPTPVYRSGRCYRSIRNGYWPPPWVCVVLDRRPLSPDLALARGLLHRLRALRSTRRGRRFGRPGGDWCVLYIDPVPIMVRRPDFAGGSSAVRIKRSWTAP